MSDKIKQDISNDSDSDSDSEYKPDMEESEEDEEIYYDENGIIDEEEDDEDEDEDEDEDDEEEEDDEDEDEDEEDDEEDDEDSGEEYDDDPIVYLKPAPWRRKRIESEDYTTDERRYKALRVFQEMADTVSLVDALDIVKGSVSSDDEAMKWVVNEIEGIMKESRRPETLRISAICNQLKSRLNIEEGEGEDDEAENDNYEIVMDNNGNVANLLLQLIAVEAMKAEERSSGERENTGEEDNMAKFKRLVSASNMKGTEDKTMSFFKGLPPERQTHYIDMVGNMRSKLDNDAKGETPYLLRAMDFSVDDVTKQTIFDHITTFEKMSSQAGDYNKKKSLVKAIKALPFGKMATLPSELTSALNATGPSFVQKGSKRVRTERGMGLSNYISTVRSKIDKAIYGHEETKNQTMRIIASMISNGTATGGCSFAMKGPPGVGKTAISEEIAKALGRPCIKINMGGMSNADDFLGHGYTYEGATYGTVARAMMNAGCENPVIIFDELDKLSNTPKGRDLENVLIHMTDATQNHSFQDKYLSGININLSKVIMIFSFNDSSSISPILLDRMKIIRVGGYKLNDKVVVAKKYLLNTITKELGCPECQYKLEDVLIRDMINQYTFEGGVRKLKELLTDIIMEINLRQITGQKVGGVEVTDTMTITKDMIRNDIFKDKHPIQHTMAAKGNHIGLVNGLWANSYGIGGLIPIEAHSIPTSSKFELQLTGMQGKVMEESMKVAKTVAWRLLTKERQTELMKTWKDDGTSGVHIHCPDGSTPKDGPSAGGAITTCIVSLLSETPVDQSYAMTGEINLKGDITAIGGLEEKTFGAITAGVKTILYPKENQRDADKIREKYPELFKNSKLTMIPVDRIEQILKYVLKK